MRAATLSLLVILAACTPGGGNDTTPPDPDAARPESPALVGPIWVLTELPGATSLQGNGGRAPDLRFTDDGNVGGFAGCNSMGGPYTVAGDSLHLGPLAMTLMACDQGMDVERAYADALESVTGFRRQGQVLELLAGERTVARFEARAE